jgi:hypothetical protein
VDDRDKDALIQSIRVAVREEAQVAAHWNQTSALPLSADLDAELLLLGAAIHGKRAIGVEECHFWGIAHRELWRVALEGGTWKDIRRKLTGDETAISVFYERIRAFEWATTEERQAAAERVTELAARRKLRALMAKLEIELAHGQLDACDAEAELQRHLLEGQEQQL